ncbi:hypothetical protein ASPCAL12594 [Aspergillus calidoustus]|uniref:Uncharacterized protein n=1 Tax=Aspergillus calidoustus TaxID=454130 RepID=A0A0U5GCY0_ASPCI|nr:hypothetical protein ASPCAL12594 [Aspergillus calidoustus]
MESPSHTGEKSTIDYNQVLSQISTNLTNALNTYGPSSSQYQMIREMLEEYVKLINRIRDQGTQNLDPDTLSLAMSFLEIGK